MKKHFDFSGLPQNTLLKRIRLHPSFSLWKKQLKIFFFLSFGILLISLFLSSSISVKESFQKLLSFKSILYQQEIKNIEDFQTSVESFSREFKPLLHTLKEKLPESSYSFTQENIQTLENLSDELLLFSSSLPDAVQAFDVIRKNGDSSFLLNYLQKHQFLISSLVEDLDLLTQNIENIPFLPKNLKKQLSIIKSFLPYFKNPNEIFDAVFTLLGDKEPHKVVIWLQNSNEKRATGGFIGSFLELILNDGKIQDFEIKDIYEYDGQITDKIEVPELALSLVGDNFWSLRDANFSPEFSVSAQSFMWLYEKAGGETIDTIIAIDQSLIERILDIIGPIKIPEYNLQLNSKNFSFVLSYITEGKLDTENPKSFLAEKIIPIFLEKLKTKISPQFIISLYNKEKQNIYLYSKHEELENIRKHYSLGRDFLKTLEKQNLIPFTEISISGNKSGSYIEQNFTITEKQVGVRKKITISIKRTHEWSKKQEEQYNFLKENIAETNIPEDELLRILGKGSNHSLFQFFLPATAEEFFFDIGFQNTKTWKEFGKTVIELDLPLLYPQESQDLEFSFFLPQGFGDKKNELIFWNEKTRQK